MTTRRTHRAPGRATVRTALGLKLLAAVCLVWIRPLHGQVTTFTVDRTDDTAAAGGCSDEVPNDCSLRGAIVKANTVSAPVRIEVPAGTYGLTQPNNCFVTTSQFGNHFFQNTTSLCLAGHITLAGAGADSTVIDGNGTAPVMLVSNVSPVEIRGVTIRRGSWTAGGSLIGTGGGINNAGVLTIVDSILRENVAPTGGGIDSSNRLTLVRSRIEHNAAVGSPGSGGGIYNRGWNQPAIATIIESVISENTSGADGGGIFNYLGVLDVVASSIANNQAGLLGIGGNGGGIASFGGNIAPRVTITNSTISGNTARLGGGFYAGGSSTGTTGSLAWLRNVTIANNAAALQAGGLLKAELGSTVYLQNTIVAHNSAPSFPDCYDGGRASAITSMGFNLIGRHDDSCTLVGDLTGNILNVDARLGLLTDNGGATPTHALRDDSPAIDAGSPALPGSAELACAANDQRGFLRPIGARCDIGAFERARGFEITRIQPAKGGNSGTISAIVSGNGFVRGTAVRLERAGEDPVDASPSVIDVGGSAIAIAIDLRGRSTGAWDVVVTRPDGASVRRPHGFVVEAPRPPDLWIEIVGRTHRPGRLTKLTIAYGNTGNVDATDVPLSLLMPNGYDARRFFPISPPPVQPGQMRSDWSEVPVVVRATPEQGVRVAPFIQVPLLLPLIPAGFTGILQIAVTLPLDAEDSAVGVTFGDPSERFDAAALA